MDHDSILAAYGGLPPNAFTLQPDEEALQFLVPPTPGGTTPPMHDVQKLRGMNVNRIADP